jgi:hypothetical protein
MLHSKLRPSWQGLMVAAVCLGSLTGCHFFGQRSGLSTNYNLPLTVQLRLDQSVTGATLDYRDACGQTVSLPIHPQLEQAVEKRMKRVFQRAGTRAETAEAPDGIVEVALGLREIDLFVPRKSNKSYPATATLGIAFAYQDQAGNVLHSKKLQTSASGEVEAKAESCDIAGLAYVAQEAIDKLAEGMAEQLGTAPKIREVAQLKKSGAVPVAKPLTPPVETAEAAPGLAPTAPSTSQPEAVPSQSATPTNRSPLASAQDLPIGPSKLSFRTILRDENRNQVLEQAETFTVEFEVKNEGTAPAQAVGIGLTGHPAIVGALKPWIEVGVIGPGEIRRLSVEGKLGAVADLEQAELVCTLQAAEGVELPSAKKFVVAVSPDRADEVEVLSVDVDQLPKAPGKLKQPNAVGIAIGVGSFRDPAMPPVKFAAHDAEIMGKYFYAVLGIPANRVKVVTDTQGLKDDLVEAFEQWLPKQGGPPTIAYIYMSGRAVVDAETGAVSVVPYDGTLTSSGRTLSLPRVQRALARSSIKKAIFLLDLSLDPSSGADSSRPTHPAWDQQDNEEGVMWMVGNGALQEAHAYQQGQHGLFTYYLLKGLRGAGDLDKNGTVMAGELCAYVHGQVDAVARQFGNQQEPVCRPGAGETSLMRSVPLSKLK